MANEHAQNRPIAIKVVKLDGSEVYEFAQFTLDRIKLCKSGEPIETSPIKIGILRRLAQNAVDAPGLAVPEEELHRAGWPTSPQINYKDNLTEQLYQLRKLLGEELLPRGGKRVLNCVPAVQERRVRFLPVAVALVSGCAGALLTTIPSRALLSSFGYTLTRADGISGIFQGIVEGSVGAVIWAIAVGSGVLLALFSSRAPRPDGTSNPDPVHRWWVGGGIGGLLGGLTVQPLVAQLFTILPPEVNQFKATWAAMAFPILGSSVGAGVGWLARTLLPGLRARVGVRFDRRVFARAMADGVKTTLANSWKLALLIVLAIAISAVNLSRHRTNGPAGETWQAGLAGEALNLFLSGIGLVIGLFAGRYIKVEISLWTDRE